MNHPTGEPRYAASSAAFDKNAQSAKAVKPNASTPTSAQALPNDRFFPQMSEALSSERLSGTAGREMSPAELPPAPQRPEGVLSSLELAQNTSEVLAWVDDLLDECMAAEGMMLVSQDYDPADRPKEHHPRSRKSRHRAANVRRHLGGSWKQRSR